MNKFYRIFILLYFLLALLLWRDQENTPARQVILQKISYKNEPKAIPNDWLAKQKLFPHGKFNHDHYLNSLKQAEILHRSSPPYRATWELAGPINIGGRITDIAIHPSFPNPWFIGAASGGIYKTTNAGSSWQNVFTQAPVISIGALAIDPSNPNILYAGTGEANASSYSFIGNGMYKSVDAGNTWLHIGLEHSAYFGRIIVDYSNSQRVFSAACGTLFSPNSHRGIYRSNDGGTSWTRVLYVTDSTAGVDLIQHPTNPNILYATMWERMRGLTYRRSHGVSSGIYKTMDGGNTWTLLTNGLPPVSQIGRMGIALAQSNPNVLYVFIDRLVGGSNVASVFRSNNAGNSWVQTNDGVLVNMNRNFGWYFGQIRVDPQNENRIWALGVELFRSDNGGNSYVELAGYGNINNIYVDQHAMYIDPNTGFLVHGNDGGLYTSNNYGTTWSKINNIPLTQFYAIEVDYLNPLRIYGGTQDNNTIRTPTGTMNDWQRILGGDGFHCVVDYTNSNIIYAEYQWGGLSRSMNGGTSFQYIGGSFDARTNWSSPFVIHPTDPNTLYFGTYRIWKTTNRGDTWIPISGDLTRNLVTLGFSTITTIDISKLNPQRLIVGSDDGRVHVTTNGGTTWTDISSGLPLRWITRVAFDPFNADIVYVTLSGFRWDEPHAYIFRANIQEPAWQQISGNLPELPVNVVAADPGKQNRLFVGTDAGVFYTENGGLSWSSLAIGLPNAPVTSMKIHHPTRKLVIGTYGCSAYTLNLDLLTGIDKPADLMGKIGVILRPVYPNPFKLSSNALQMEMECYLAYNADATLAVIDLSGKTVISLFSGQLAGGAHRFSWSGLDEGGNRLTPGIHILNLNTSIGSAQQKILLVP
ncbi:MAG: FlgD immunoglobulin-like domain containing protein [Bacteroidales bacterium]|nr:FlgD immunoglobulin-like domain containing protein [Bacteroidales bacterium]